MFAHVFLTMEWNLMARSDNCVNMHVQHIKWRSDSLIHYFGNSKVNQTRDTANDPWRVYSKPKNQTIYPVLTLSNYFFSHPDILTTYFKLFPGNHQYEIILKIFHRIINAKILKNYIPLELIKERLDPNLSGKDQSQ